MTPEAEIDRATALMRAALLHAGQVCKLAGNEAAARKLVACPVRWGAKLTCVFRHTRDVEAALTAGWAVAKLGRSPQGYALEAVLLVRTAAIRLLMDLELGAAWVERVVEPALRLSIESLGAVPEWSVERAAELARTEEDDAGADGKG
jgi:hypothetical protein